MRENGLHARQKRRFKRTTDSQHAFPVAPNILDQDFAAAGPNQKWGVAMVETFFKTLKSELIWRAIYQTRDQAEIAIARYIDGFYNPMRRHSGLKYLSPAQYERLAA